jgi:hypothetical protein
VGTYLWSYAVDLETLASAFGSGDELLARRAIKTGDVAHNTEWFEDQIAKGAPRLDEAIHEIIAGKLTKKKHAFQYTYACEALCRVIGASVGDELKMGGWIEELADPLLKKVKSKDFCHLLHLHKERPPIKIPKCDSPFVSYLTLAEVNGAIGSFARVEMRVENEELAADARGAVDFVLQELDTRLRGATRRRSGLVSFMY